ncbi:MAG: hypothetical protein KDC33_00140 [Thermoleophilia bacterium]|nr:hypothetical protein [Thermoleophilia bacterium]
MRPKSTDVQGNNRSAPACGHCGLPLAADTTVCPFCEKRVARVAPNGGRMILGVSERTLLLVAAGILTLAAAVTALAALTS